MLFDDYKEPVFDVVEVTHDPDVIAGALKFDWETNTFEILDGSPVIVRGGNAVKEFLQLTVRTKPGRCPIYPVDFGGNAMEYIGKKIPKGFGLSEFKRRMVETAGYCPGIANIDGFEYDGSRIHCEVELTDGTREVEEIEY